MTTDQLHYPIGQYQAPEIINQEQIENWISQIEEVPALYLGAVNDLNEKQLDTPYRPEGWTVRQVIHHVPDSHMNSYIRYLWALTEDSPKIKAYDERAWANLKYFKQVPIELSLDLLKSVHSRWVILLKNMTDSDFKKTFIHPENGRTLSLDWVTGLYAWHGKHHLAHIENLKERMGW